MITRRERAPQRASREDGVVDAAERSTRGVTRAGQLCIVSYIGMVVVREVLAVDLFDRNVGCRKINYIARVPSSNLEIRGFIGSTSCEIRSIYSVGICVVDVASRSSEG